MTSSSSSSSEVAISFGIVWKEEAIAYYNKTPKWRDGSLRATLRGQGVSGRLHVGVVDSNGMAVEQFQWRSLDDRNRNLPTEEQVSGMRYEFVGDHSAENGTGPPTYPFFDGMSIDLHVRRATVREETFFAVFTVVSDTTAVVRSPNFFVSAARKSGKRGRKPKKKVAKKKKPPASRKKRKVVRTKAQIRAIIDKASSSDVSSSSSSSSSSSDDEEDGQNSNSSPQVAVMRVSPRRRFLSSSGANMPSPARSVASLRSLGSSLMHIDYGGSGGNDMFDIPLSDSMALHFGGSLSAGGPPVAGSSAVVVPSASSASDDLARALRLLAENQAKLIALVSSNRK
jgi:hypothetical protein